MENGWYHEVVWLRESWDFHGCRPYKGTITYTLVRVRNSHRHPSFVPSWLHINCGYITTLPGVMMSIQGLKAMGISDRVALRVWRAAAASSFSMSYRNKLLGLDVTYLPTRTRCRTLPSLLSLAATKRHIWLDNGWRCRD